ncbi:DNA repair protein RecO, N-terminal domain-containing protein [[Mycoplasma] cavipharyngis]|uniref:DNA repair protein RecO n=1 Tax=[Mycoplasma] cavipharyngis TaxID=92757 RepID=UPI003704C57C
MSEKIVNGYLLSEREYQDIDKIIKLISHEKIFSCLALGVRKINSKNSRNLFFGHLIEIHFFEARMENKLSKLKKVYLLENLDQDLINNKSVIFLNNLFEKINHQNPNINLFEIYQKFIEIIKLKKYDDDLIINYILVKSQIIFGFQLNYRHCNLCQTKQKITSISLDNYGLLCNLCSKKTNTPKWSNDALLLFLFLNQNDLEKANNHQIANSLVCSFMKKVYQKLTGIRI